VQKHDSWATNQTIAQRTQTENHPLTSTTSLTSGT
jgi:hypothetical protein